MIIDTKTRIPGVPVNDKFVEWLLEDKSIVVNPKLRIGASDLGGIGLFFATGDNDKKEGDIVLARIPQKATYDYQRLLEVLEELKQKGTEEEDADIERGIITTVLKSMQPTSESEILYCYFIGFKICYQRRAQSAKQYVSPLTSLDPYLHILENTWVSEPPKGDINDEFLKRLAAQVEDERAAYDELIADLEPIAPGLTFAEYYQIIHAIRSRVLEIPYANDEGDDYYTNISLVPLLDFANHAAASQSNSYFDVDKATNDVVLKLNGSKMTTGTFEITISYSTTESIQHFIQTYGFIPASDDYQLLEVKIPAYSINEHTNKIMNTSAVPYDRIMKWLHVLPQFQLVKSKEDIFVNFFSNNLPLVFVDGLRYDELWPDNAYKSFTTNNDIEISEQDFADSVFPVLERQEADYDFVNGLGQIGVSYNSAHPKINSLLEETNNDSDEAFQQLIKRCTELIVEIAKSIVTSLPQQSKSLSQLSREYTAKQLEFCQALIAKSNSNNDLSLPISEAKEEWETHYRTAPKQIILNE